MASTGAFEALSRGSSPRSPASQSTFHVRWSCEHTFVIPDIDPPDLHWLAGLLEGEGSFFPGAPSSPHLPVLQIQMIDEDVMNRVGELMDRGVYRCRPPRPEWSVTYRGAREGRSGGRLDAPPTPASGQASPGPNRSVDRQLRLQVESKALRLARPPRVGAARAGPIGSHSRFPVRRLDLVHLRPATRQDAQAPVAPGLAVLRVPRHSAALCSALSGRASGRDDSQDPHCLQAQGEALSAVG